jgi:hypothetical protein
MTTTGSVHVGDIGTHYKARIQDNGAAFGDVALATEAVLLFQTPAGVLERDATITNEGADWFLNYVVVDETFHARAGVYRWQGHVTFADGQTFHTSTESYRVEPNLEGV